MKDRDFVECKMCKYLKFKDGNISIIKGKPPVIDVETE